MLAYGNVVIFFRILLDHYYNYLTAAANSVDQFNLSTIRNSLVTRQVSMKVRKHIIANDIFFHFFIKDNLITYEESEHRLIMMGQVPPHRLCLFA